jgi:hypothetical protein
MREEFYKKKSIRSEGLLPQVPAIVQSMLMAHPRRRQMTKGKAQPRLVSVVALDGQEESAVLALAASLAPGL